MTIAQVNLHCILKRNVQFIFLCDPHKSSANVSFMKILKSTVTKKTKCFYDLVEGKFKK